VRSEWAGEEDRRKRMSGTNEEVWNKKEPES